MYKSFKILFFPQPSHNKSDIFLSNRLGGCYRRFHHPDVQPPKQRQQQFHILMVRNFQ